MLLVSWIERVVFCLQRIAELKVPDLSPPSPSRSAILSALPWSLGVTVSWSLQKVRACVETSFLRMDFLLFQEHLL